MHTFLHNILMYNVLFSCTIDPINLTIGCYDKSVHYIKMAPPTIRK